MKTPKLYDNSLIKDTLDLCWLPSHLLLKYPTIEAIFVGVSKLDYGGNSRPLSITKLFYGLTCLEIISTATVMEAYQCSERHAQKVAAALRILSRAVEKELTRLGVLGAGGEFIPFDDDYID